jgi:hypothetical protein
MVASKGSTNLPNRRIQEAEWWYLALAHAFLRIKHIVRIARQNGAAFWLADYGGTEPKAHRVNTKPSTDYLVLDEGIAPDFHKALS